jgi:hypothetical protein
VKFWGNTEYKLPAEAGFILDKVPATAAVLRAKIKDTPCKKVVGISCASIPAICLSSLKYLDFTQRCEIKR